MATPADQPLLPTRADPRLAARRVASVRDQLLGVRNQAQLLITERRLLAGRIQARADQAARDVRYAVAAQAQDIVDALEMVTLIDRGLLITQWGYTVFPDEVLINFTNTPVSAVVMFV